MGGECGRRASGERGREGERERGRGDIGRPVNSIAEDSGGTRGNSIVSMLGAAIA